MTTEPREPDVRTLWQRQPLHDERAIALEDVHRKARALERRFRRTDLIMYTCGLVQLGAFGAVMWFLPGLRIVAALVLLTAAVIVYQYHRRRPTRAAAMAGTDDLASSACLDYYRTSLERKREMSRRLGTWFLPPAILGQAVIIVGFIVAPPNVPRRLVLMVLPFWIAADIVIFVVGWRKHRREAETAQRELDALTALAR